MQDIDAILEKYRAQATDAPGADAVPAETSADAHGADEEDDGGAAAADAAPEGEQVAGQAEDPAAAPAPAQPDAAKDDGTAARIAEKNRELVAELAKLRAGAPSHGTAGEAMAAKAAREYLQDPAKALRMWVAAGLGVEDIADKAVDAELEGLLLENIGAGLGVPLDPTKRLEHEHRRLRRQLELQRADAARPAAPPDETGERIAIIQRTAAPMLDKFPLAKMSAFFERAELPAVVNQVLYERLASGEFDPRADNETLVRKSLEIIEADYSARADRIVAARKPADSPSVGAGDKQGARTVTSINASVAPTKAPAKPTQPKAAPKEYASEDERRAAVLARYFK